MSSEEVIVGSIVGVTVGIVAAHLGSRAINRVKEQIHKEELEDAVKAAYNDGWRDASHNPGNIRKRYEEMFDNPDENAGITAKTRKS